MNIIKDLHHLVEKQRSKHIKSLYYRVFLGCSGIKGPFRTPMKAVGPLLSESRHVHAHSEQVQTQTHKSEALWTTPASSSRKHSSFFLSVPPLSCPASESPPHGWGIHQWVRSSLPSPGLQGQVPCLPDSGCRSPPWAPGRCTRWGAHSQGLPTRPCPGSRSAPRSNLITLLLAVTLQVLAAHTASHLSYKHSYPLVWVIM